MCFLKKLLLLMFDVIFLNLMWWSFCLDLDEIVIVYVGKDEVEVEFVEGIDGNEWIYW